MNEVVANGSTPESQTAGQDTGAQTDNLDDILSQIDKDFEKETTVKEAPAEKTDEVKSRLEALEQRELSASVSEAVSTVKSGLEGLDVRIKDRTVRAYLYDLAREDQRFAKAFAERHVNPQAWNKVLKASVKEIANDFKDQPDQKLTDDRRAVISAVRGTKTETEGDAPLNMNGWSDQRFQNWKITGKDNPNL